jgi:hypothetical protein
MPIQHRQDVSRRRTAGLTGADLGVGDEPRLIEDKAGRDRQRPTLVAVEKWEVDAALPVDVSDELRNTAAHAEQLGNSAASVAENRKTQLQLCVGFCVSETVCREMLTRDAPRASTDWRWDSNACKSRLHACHHVPV